MNEPICRFRAHEVPLRREADPIIGLSQKRMLFTLFCKSGAGAIYRPAFRWTAGSQQAFVGA